MGVKFQLPTAAFKVKWEEVDHVAHTGNIKLVPSDAMEEWLVNHNVTDYAFMRDDELGDLVIEFKHDPDALLYKLSWSDKY